jgi:hypothetical protein
MSSKRDKDNEKKEELIKILNRRSTEDLLDLRNIHREGKDNKYWRVAVKEILKSRGIDS